MTLTTKAPAALPDFETLCRQYPSLSRLLVWVRDIQDDPERPYFCANAEWYGYGHPEHSLRARVVEIAHRAVKRYGSWRVYDTVYQGVYDLLPDCRNCGCFVREEREAA